MKILWLTPLFPYPLYSGGQVRAYNLIKNLARNHQITLFSFVRPEREQGPAKEMEKFCVKVKTFKGRRTWTLRNVLLAGFSHLPFTITHFYGDRAVEGALRKELAEEKYDLIHFESFYTSPYLKSGLGLPTVLGNENIEYRIYQRFIQQNPLPLRLLLGYDVWKMRHYEENAWKRADLNLAVSEIDAERIKEVTGKECSVIPNGVDLEFFRYRQKSLSRKAPLLLFVGDFKYFANQDAAKFLVKSIWPEIKTKTPAAKLWLVGRNPNQFVKNIVTKDIILNERIKDIRQAYSRADVLVAPMRLASGTNIKILEAMASGLPVVTTSAGIEGIRAVKEKEVVVRDSPQEFAEEIASLLKNKKQSQQLGRAGRALVKKRYGWSKISEKLEEVYRKQVQTDT